MSGNTFIVSDLVAQEALTAFNQESMFLRTVDNSRNSTYGDNTFVSGNTINVKKPTLFSPPNSGNNLVVQGITQTEIPLTVYQFNISMTYSLNQATTAIRKKQVMLEIVTPMVQEFVRSIEQFWMKVMACQTTNILGSPGTALSSPDQFAFGRAQLQQYLVPAGKIYGAITPTAQASLFGNNKALYNPQKDISDIYLSGDISNQAGTETYSTNNVPTISTITSGALGTPVSGTIGTGGTTLTVTGMNGSAVIPAGTKFTIAGIYGVDPQTKGRLGLQVFTVFNGITQSSLTMPTINDVVASGGTAVLPISPAIITSGTEQTVTAAPAPGTAITFVGASGVAQANGSYKANMQYHRSAYQLASVPMAEPNQGGIATRKKDPKSGLDILVCDFYAGMSTSNIISLTSLIGMVAGRPMWGNVLAGE